MKRLTTITLFIALGGFLVSRWLNGTLSYYIHPRFNVLTVLTAVALLLLALAQWQNGRRSLHSHETSWLGLAILAIPVLLGLLIQPQPLGANALNTREVSLNPATAGSVTNGRLDTIRTGPDANILDWLAAFGSGADLTLFNGAAANVLGFVYRDERFQDDTFMVSRFTISCCVADANPVGLIVRWPDAPDLADDTWVQVNGRFQLQPFNGDTIPILIADSVTPTNPPTQPYLYQ